MAERRLTQSALERELTELGRQIEFPETPALSGRVRARIREAPLTSAPRRWQLRPRWALALAALVILLAGALVVGLWPGAREAVADLLGLRGVSIRIEEPAPTPTPISQSAPAGTLIVDGAPVTLAEARQRLTFPIAAPASLGAPDAVYVAARPPSGGQVSLIYGPRPGLPVTQQTGVGLLLTEFRASISDQALINKSIGSGSRLEAVSVAGARGYWIEGAPHRFLYRDSRGDVHEERSRLAGNTLLWERDGITYRLESALSRDEAIRLAEEVR